MIKTNYLHKINLKMFGFEKDFFTNAFNEAYNIGEGVSEPIEATESVSVGENDQTPNETTQEVLEPSQTPTKELSKEEIKELYEKHFKEEETTTNQIEYDEETQNAIELYKYLEQNSHIVQAMRELDAKG